MLNGTYRLLHSSALALAACIPLLPVAAVAQTSSSVGASYPTDIRAGAGFKIQKQGLSLRITADYSNVPMLDPTVNAGNILVQDPVTGQFGRLDIATLPPSVPRDASVTLQKFSAVPAFSIIGNLTSSAAQPQYLAPTQVKTALALDQVNNTADTDKPISTAQAAALAGKAQIENPVFTGTVTTDTLKILGSTSTGDMSGLCIKRLGAPLCRPQRERAADLVPNVRDFGAKLDASQDDLSAFNLARAAAGSNGTVDVPAGGLINISANPTAGSAKPILWRLLGQPAGSVPQGIGGDTVEQVLDGAKFLTKISNQRDPSEALRVDHTFNYDGNGAGEADSGTSAALSVNTFIPRVRARNYIWGMRSIMYSSAYGSAQHVALTGSAFRPANALSDGKGPRSPIWGAYAEGTDQTNRPSNESGVVHGMEINLGSGNADPVDNRVILLLSAGLAGGATSSQVGTGISVGGAPNVAIGKMIRISGNYYNAGIDLTDAVPQNNGGGLPPAIRLKQEQYIALDETNTLTLREITGLVQWRNGPSEIYRLTGQGATEQPGYAKFGSISLNQSGVGLNTTGASLTGPAVSLADQQPIAWEATNQITTRSVNGALVSRNGATETYRLDGAGNTSQPGTATATGGVKAPSVTSATANNGVLTGAFVRAGDPTTTDIPSGQCADWNNTTAGTFKRVCNFAGTLRSATLN